jgi:SAM-dependent methyltransferase
LWPLWTVFFDKPGSPGESRKKDNTLRQSGAIYLQYGCGQSCPDGWINFDASPTLRLQRLPVIGRLFKRGATVFPDGVRFGDIVRGLPIADGSVQGIYASHVLEHLSYADFWRALDHTFRLLRPGGIFRLVVPDLKSRAQKYLERLEMRQADANSWFLRSARLGSEGSPRGPVELARSLIGRSAHLWMWDEISLAAALDKTGFVNIRRCRFGDRTDGKFSLVEDAGRFYDAKDLVEECGMEAMKPAGHS